MSYTGYPSYGSYQPYSNLTYQPSHYASQYNLPIPSAISYNPYIPHHDFKTSPAPDLPPPPPDLTSVTASEASSALQRLISKQLRDAGFDGSEPLAMRRLELQIESLVEMLYGRAHEYANLANRAGPITTDLVLACRDLNLQTKDLYRVGSSSRKNKNQVVEAPRLIPPRSHSPSPELLSSDDEGGTPAIPTTLRTLPPYFPDLPPKHTYLRTPASPPKRAALPSLEKKLKTAGLVQESLKNLLIATEDITNQEDGELLGHIVNWEAGLLPRKRWKISH